MPKAKTASSPAIVTYKDLRKETHKAQKDRIKYNIGRQGKPIIPRKMHLSEEEIASLITMYAATGGTINPFALRKGGGLYYSQVESLIVLGIDKFHHCSQVYATIKDIMSAVPKKSKDGTATNAWEISENRTSGRIDVNPTKRKSMAGKLEQNYRVLQRIGINDRYPYGEKLRQFNMSIEVEFRLPEGITDFSLAVAYFKLKTDWDNYHDVVPSCHNPYTKRGRRKAKVLDVEPDEMIEPEVEVEVEVEVELEDVLDEAVEEVAEIVVEEEAIDAASYDLDDELFDDEEEDEELVYDDGDDDGDYENL